MAEGGYTGGGGGPQPIQLEPGPPNPNLEGASTVIPDTVPPDGAAVINAQIIPGIEILREFIQQFGAEIRENDELRQRYAENPRLVLGERGLYSGLQENFAAELDPEAGAGLSDITTCCITTITF